MFIYRIKYILNVIFFISLSSAVYAHTHSDDIITLFTIKIYSEPHNRPQKFSYIMTLPKWEYYSYYLGSDLPTWHVVNERIFKGEFYSGELVTIRIHSKKYNNNKIVKKSMAHLSVIDENSRVIWQGEFNYGNGNKIKISTQINNQKDYATTLKFDKTVQTVWLETQALD